MHIHAVVVVMGGSRVPVSLRMLARVYAKRKDQHTPLHPSTYPHQYITAHSDAEVVVVDNVGQLQKYAMATRDQLPRLKVQEQIGVC